MITAHLPFLSRLDSPDGSIAYAGLVCVHGREYQLSLQLPAGHRPGRTLKGTQIWTDEQLGEKLRGSADFLQQRIATCTTLSELGRELDQFLREAIDPQRPDVPIRNVPTLLRDLDAVGAATVTSLSAGFRSVQLQVQDAAKRAHVLTLDIPEDYPARGPRVTCQLPEDYHLRWDIDKRLAGTVHAFCSVLERYQELWDTLDDLDQHTAVRHIPEHRYSVAERTLELGPSCQMKLTMAPTRPHDVPEITFTGAEAVVKQCQTNLNERIKLWDHSRPVRDNLAHVLNMTLPGPSDVAEESSDVLCEICYVGQDLDVVCSNERCMRRYHSECLLSLFRREGKRQSFNMVFGECLYCHSTIAVKV